MSSSSSTTKLNGRVIFSKPPTSKIVPGEHLTYIEETIDLETLKLSDGQVLVKTIVLSPDPYLRGKLRAPDQKVGKPPFTLGEPINGFGIAKVLRSEDKKFSIGSLVLSPVLSWEHFSVSDAARLQTLELQSDAANIPISAYIGVLGMPGQTAYLGLKAFGQLKKGETIFVTSASGAVGSLVVQLAKLQGLKVIGSAGADNKVAYVKDELHADVSFNYKESDTVTDEILAKHGPVDIYWDNVGGKTLDSTLAAMNKYGRVISCGLISNYEDGQPYRLKNFHHVLVHELNVHGFLVSSYWTPEALKEFFKDLVPLVKSGEIKFKEERTVGLENAAQALADLLTGGNFGKAIVEVDIDA